MYAEWNFASQCGNIINTIIQFYQQFTGGEHNHPPINQIYSVRGSKKMKEEKTEMIPRSYQTHLMRIANKQNSIIYLPTGSGKTYIAILLLKEMTRPLEKSYAEGGKIGIMLVNTVPLVQQHVKTLNKLTTLRVTGLSGEMNIDFWVKKDWLNQCEKYNMFVMTGKIVENALKQKHIDLNRIHLLIFDECHHAVGAAHTMRLIMKEFEHSLVPPRVLGLTATILNKNVKASRVLDEVNKLEVSMHSKIASVDDLEEVSIHSTNPTEYLEIFHKHELTNAEAEACSYLKELENLLHTRQQADNIELNKEHYRSDDVEVLKQRSVYKDLSRIVKDVIYHIERLGTYGGHKSVVAHHIQLQYIKVRCIDKNVLHMLQIMVTDFLKVKKVLENAMKDCETIEEKLLHHSSDQVMKFLYVVNEYSQSSLPLCCLVFVERRFTAQILFHILKEISSSCSSYSHIVCNYVTGSQANPMNNTRLGLYEAKVHATIIKDFVDHNINLLVCTNLMEEGVDIPTCSLVVKFDAPNNYCSYIQSKGRTRHRLGQYVILTSNIQAKKKYISRLADFKNVETCLNSRLVTSSAALRPGPSLAAIQRTYTELELPTYYVAGKQSAHVSMNDAVALVHMYCNSLPSDQFTKHEPIWFIEKHKMDDGRMRVLLEFPTGLGHLVDVVKGTYMATKIKAKQACALEAATLLHQIGELTDHLMPRAHCAIDEDTDFLFTHWPAVKEQDAGNTKKRRKYIRMVPSCMVKPLPTSLTCVYLHVVHMEPTFVPDTTDLPALHFHRMYSSDLCFGLLTAEAMPEVCEYPLYVSNGEINVSVKPNVQQICLTQEQLDELSVFHHLIFSGILEVLHGFLTMNSDPSMVNLLLVPVNRKSGDIQWDIVQEHKTIKPVDVRPSSQERAALVVSEESYTDHIVSKWYRSDSNVYLVLRVTELYPSSPFKTTDYGSFNDYFRDRYSMQIENQGQPLVLVKGISKRLNCLKPRGVSSNRKRNHPGEDCIGNRGDIDEELVPEFLVKQEFPGDLWVQAKVMPSVIHRLLQMIRAEEFRRLIAKKAGIGEILVEQIQPLGADKHLLKISEVEAEKPPEIDAFVENMEVDGEIIAPKKDSNTVKGNGSINSVVFEKKLDAQYPWKVIEEPVDIYRYLNVGQADIMRYSNFVNCEIKNLSDRITRVDKNAAITYNKDFCHKNISILQKSLKSQGPDLKDIYQVLASKKCNEIVNLERLETLGDSFLKLASSLYIWLKYPDYCEGKASTLKGKLISNKNLYYCGLKKNLGSLMLVSDLELANWLPPNFGLLETIRLQLERREIQSGSLFHLQLTPQEQISGLLTPVNENTLVTLRNVKLKEADAPPFDNYLGQQEVPDKTVADCVEAILGAYCESSGFEGGLRMLEWFSIIPGTERLTELLEKPLPSPILIGNVKLHSDFDDLIDNLLPNWEYVEQTIGYHFYNRAYLLQALTHATYTNNRITRSYERLEFIGDAVLDYLITMYIYEYGNNLSPGELTDLRSALVNNETFAAFAVRLDLHKSMKYMNILLQSYIEKYVDYMEHVNFEVNSSMLILINDGDVNSALNIDVPKALGDIFESVIGAIYLDCGMNMDTVWKVVYKIMYKEIDLFSACVPKNPVRLLYEKTGAYPKFMKAEMVKDRQLMVMALEVTVNAEKKLVHGYGANKKLAKKAAAKIALCLFD